MVVTAIYQSQSFFSQLCTVIEIHELKLKKKNNKMNCNCEMTFYNVNNFPLSDFGHSLRHPFMKMDSGLSTYCHGNADFPGANPHHPQWHIQG